MIRRLLIANRGEIARRIARTCRRLGIDYVAVYSEADRSSPHLQGATASVCIGPALAAQSYLNQARIVDAALAHGCDAVHPGYGFLSESPLFAGAVAAAGLIFVGPRAETIAALGDKARAKALMAKAGVPTVPGSAKATESVRALAKAADEIGYPVLLKPSAGGGGKGMQVVANGGSLRDAAERAIRLARANFGDGRLIVERFVERPRHIEVQVFGDHAGNVVHFFERECSLQRRHQKVVEEAPAARLAPTSRRAILEAAVRGARSINYLNAGTFEFIVDADGEFYFLEVNTRLQVEHPVTEAITGIDLVEWQLRIAAGQPLPLAQEHIAVRGHAFECRVYAEDPTHDFRPAPGKALHVSWPTGVRVDAGIETGGEVTSFYDPMIAKLVAHGSDRADALKRLHAAVCSTAVLGLTTNLGFLDELLRDPNVGEAAVHTHYLDQRPPSRSAPEGACAIAAALSLAAPAPAWPWSACHPVGTLDRGSLVHKAPLGTLWFWIGHDLIEASLAGWCAGKATVTVAGELFDVHIQGTEDGVHHGTLGEAAWRAVSACGCIELSLGGTRHRIEPYGERSAAQLTGAGSALSPMPGVVVALPVGIGDAVREGDVLAVVEAMKMENQVTATFDGTVTRINCCLNETVAAGHLLVTVEPTTG